MVEDAAIGWFGEQARCARTVTPAISQGERESFGEVVQSRLAQTLTWPLPQGEEKREAIRRLNPAISSRALGTLRDPAGAGLPKLLGGAGAERGGYSPHFPGAIGERTFSQRCAGSCGGPDFPAGSGRGALLFRLGPRFPSALPLHRAHRAHHAGESARPRHHGERRVHLEQALLQNRVKALVATTALGMGFDKPDLAFVIHYQTPGSVVAYYQQVGRAGRALAAAHGVLLSGQEEADINEYFIESAFPSRQEVTDVNKVLPSTLDRSHMERHEQVDLPFEMIREAVVNALIHRDYDIAGQKCQLVVDADTITIKSPGSPISPITLEATVTRKGR